MEKLTNIVECMPTDTIHLFFVVKFTLFDRKGEGTGVVGFTAVIWERNIKLEKCCMTTEIMAAAHCHGCHSCHSHQFSKFLDISLIKLI